MVTWYYKQHKADFYYKRKDGKIFKIGLYGGNCLGAMVYRYSLIEEGKRVKYYQFISFFNDIGHAKRVLKDNLIDRFIIDAKITKITIYLSKYDKNKYQQNELIKLTLLLLHKGYKITIK